MRKGLAVVVAAWAALAAASGCGGGEPVLTGHPGYPTYARFCSRCHGNRGDGKRASRMAGRTVDLGSAAYADTARAARVRRVVAEGHGRMKGYADKLSEKEVDAVTGYVLAMGTARPGPEDP